VPCHWRSCWHAVRRWRKRRKSRSRSSFRSLPARPRTAPRASSPTSSVRASVARSWSGTRPAPAARSACSRSPESAPDGDTLGVGATGALLLNPNLPSNPGPDLLRELAPVAKLIEVALVLVANPSTGPKSISDMIDRSKTTPGGLTYGSTGTNSSQHLSVELLKRETGANLVHVPYRGSAPAVVDVIAGD